mmetsp:Transcript_1924/g.2749  ORF Transcript_1924/g.2749 Transcript_1924/m.2749 type:complete len:93 (+) Transcript_1924:1186-1464(+)
MSKAIKWLVIFMVVIVFLQTAMIHMHKNEAMSKKGMYKFLMTSRLILLALIVSVGTLLYFIYSKSSDEILDFLGKKSCSNDEFLNSTFATID